MSFLKKIEPHLLSEELLIQKFILRLLSEYYPFVPPEWTERLLNDALQSKVKEFNILMNLEKLPFSERAVMFLIEGLKNSDASNQYLYLRLVDKIEPELAFKYREQLEPYAPKDNWDFYRILLEGSEEEVWETYGDLLGGLGKSPEHNHQLYSKAKLLVKTLIHKGWVDENEIDLILGEQLHEKYFAYHGILAVYMIGLLKLPKYIPLLVSFLDRDDDILLEETADALISFQSDEVVESVVPYARMQESSIFAISVLSGTKTPLATQVLKDLMTELTDEDDQSIVFEALCHQLSDAALPEIEAYLKNHPQSYLVEIEELAYGFYKVMGENHPYLEEWKRIAEKNEADFAKDMERQNQPSSLNPKVGRNDPCPCGSGKKYKKCCGA
ncbi:SEC-C metal-binding domain-containing protein [Neobacillus sp. D3-1R]|uniref:SEC-C metal-binding domain-containing protein n=1 Tax=Neobacillus sp. D3-1R TaxID=3445778 RepID=UPI003F9FFF3D